MYTRYYLDSVEIDNPITESKISVPVFVTYNEPVFQYKDTPASTFSLQTLFDAGIPLKPSTVVTSSFLRETEKFMTKVENTNIN